MTMVAPPSPPPASSSPSSSWSWPSPTALRGTIASHHAKVVADLSAVAGAYAAYTGADPCDTAATVARRNAAILDHCATSGDDVTVTVFDAPAHAVATAGPR